MATRNGGHAALILPSNTSEFQAMIDAMRAHHSAMHGQLVDIASYLKGVLPDVIAGRGGGRAGFLGIDNKIAARQIVKPLMDAAGLNDWQGRLYVQAYQRYQERVVNISSGSGPRPKFDANK
jgi:hypothetical protein